MPLITYNSAAMSSKISEIDKVESNYKQSAEEIDGYIQQILANWKGTDADIAKGDFDTIKKDLTDISNNIVTIKTILGNVQTNMSNNKYG